MTLGYRFVKGKVVSRVRLQAKPVKRKLNIASISRSVSEDRVDLTGDRAIGIEPWRHEHQFGTFTQRCGRQHRRTHSELARFAARCGDDATSAASDFWRTN